MKFQEHQISAARTKSFQDAIKVLYDAGIDIRSDEAEDLLKKGKVSTDIIEGVKAFAQKKTAKNSSSSDTTPSRNKLPSHSKFELLKNLNEDMNLINNIDGEANPIESKKVLRISDMTSNSYSHTKQNNKVSAEDLYTSFEESKAINEDSMNQICVCQRCFKLEQYGTVEQSLRPGWSTNELLTPERFEFLLGEIQKTNAVVLCLIDLFDIYGNSVDSTSLFELYSFYFFLSGSMLSNLKQIAGSNPIVIAANKIDLLPAEASEARLKNWVISEIKSFCNLKSPKDFESENNDRLRQIRSQVKSGYVKKVDETGILRSNNVHLVSCHTGMCLNNTVL